MYRRSRSRSERRDDLARDDTREGDSRAPARRLGQRLERSVAERLARALTSIARDGAERPRDDARVHGITGSERHRAPERGRAEGTEKRDGDLRVQRARLRHERVHVHQRRARNPSKVHREWQ